MHRIIQSDKDTVVIYHDNCPDGFTAAWAAWESLGDNADYFTYQNGDTMESSIKDKKVFILDVAPSIEELKQLSLDNDVMVIDHHISHRPKLDAIKNFSFDLNKSGAVLAWEYFHPDKDVPLMVRYIQDRDLWLWEMKDSRAVTYYIDSIDHTFKAWREAVKDFEDENKLARFVEIGHSLIEYSEKIIDKTINKSLTEVEFEGYNVLAVNATSLTDEIASRLYKMHPPFAIVWFQVKDKIRVSLRATPESEVDVAKLAEKHGGGGHRGSAGFLVDSVKDLPWKIIK